MIATVWRDRIGTNGCIRPRAMLFAVAEGRP